MENRKSALASGLTFAAWGLLIMLVNFNINNVNVLPSFVGYMLILSVLPKLEGARRQIKLLRPLAVLLSVWSVVDWLFSFAGESLAVRIPVVHIIITVVSLYFHFQLLTDLAAIAEEVPGAAPNIPERLRLCRTVEIVVETLVFVLPYIFKGETANEIAAFIVIPLVIVTIAAAIAAVVAMFRLRRLALDMPDDGEADGIRSEQ